MLDTAPVPMRDAMRMPPNAGRLLRLDRRDLGLAFTFAMASTVINTSGSVYLLRERSLFEVADFVGQGFLTSFVLGALLVAALEALERISLAGWRRHLVTAAAGVALAALIYGPTAVWEWPVAGAGVKYGVASSPMAFLLYTMWFNAALALIARAWFVRSREETRATKLLVRIRAEQASIRRRLIEARLKAIQARVDPLFFFEMLDTVRKTYVVDFDRAEKLLDELTTFLRAALPRLRSASSTVVQECELAHSFARLHVLAGLGSANLDIEIAPSAGSADFPPGVLLPLIAALLRSTESPNRVRVAYLTDTVSAKSDSLEVPNTGGLGREFARPMVIMRLTAAASPPAEVLTEIRGRLADLFGDAGLLISSVVEGGFMTIVEVPYAPARA